MTKYFGKFTRYTDSSKKKIKRDLSSCITEKFSIFQMVRSMLGSKPKTELKPIYIIFDPVKHYKQKINCHFPTKKHLVYRTLCSAEKLGK